MGALFAPSVVKAATAVAPAAAIQSTTEEDPVLDLNKEPSTDLKKKKLGKSALRVDNTGLMPQSSGIAGLQIPTS